VSFGLMAKAYHALVGTFASHDEVFQIKIKLEGKILTIVNFDFSIAQNGSVLMNFTTG